MSGTDKGWASQLRDGARSRIRARRESRLVSRLAATPGVRLGARARVEGRACIEVARLVAGDDFLLWSHEATTLLAGRGTIELGERVFINSGARVIANNLVRIGDDVLIGLDAVIVDSSMHGQEGRPVQHRTTIIGSGSWVGMRAIVMPGVRLGERCIVAAGAVVTSDVPPDTLVAGVPARVVRGLNHPRGARRAWNNDYPVEVDIPEDRRR